MHDPEKRLININQVFFFRFKKRHYGQIWKMMIGMRSLHNLCANRILPIFCLKPEYSLYLTVVIVPFWETRFCVVQTEISPPHTPSLPIQPAGLFYDCCSEHVILASCRAKIKKRCGWCDGAPAVVLAPAWAPGPVLLKLGRLMAARSLHACQAPQMDLPASPTAVKHLSDDLIKTIRTNPHSPMVPYSFNDQMPVFFASGSVENSGLVFRGAV